MNTAISNNYIKYEYKGIYYISIYNLRGRSLVTDHYETLIKSKNVVEFQHSNVHIFFISFLKHKFLFIQTVALVVHANDEM